jgi:hypothetical protein
MEEAAEAVMSVDVQLGGSAWVGDRFGQWLERCGVGDALMGPVCVVERLVFAEGVQEMPLSARIASNNAGYLASGRG